jgi:hypothetical protein
MLFVSQESSLVVLQLSAWGWVIGENKSATDLLAVVEAVTIGKTFCQWHLENRVVARPIVVRRFFAPMSSVPLANFSARS